MRLSVHYLSDAEGNVEAVQLPVADWKRVLRTLKEQTQALRVKTDITAALEEVEQIRNSKQRPETLQKFLRGL